MHSSPQALTGLRSAMAARNQAPTPGAYRTRAVLEQMPAEIASMLDSGELRLAQGDKPISGAVRASTVLTQELIRNYTRIGLEYYAAGLSTGRVVAIIISTVHDRTWRPGELFFRS